MRPIQTHTRHAHAHTPGGVFLWSHTLSFAPQSWAVAGLSVDVPIPPWRCAGCGVGSMSLRVTPPCCRCYACMHVCLNVRMYVRTRVYASVCAPLPTSRFLQIPLPSTHMTVCVCVCVCAGRRAVGGGRDRVGVPGLQPPLQRGAAADPPQRARRPHAGQPHGPSRVRMHVCAWCACACVCVSECV
jgi:hypothetical protein